MTAAEVQLIHLPPRPAGATPVEVEMYAALCLAHLHLRDWHFGWDKTTRRLGCCKMQQRRISLSRYYAEAYASREPEQLWRTLLHELAHALAWQHRGARGHGPVWQRYCTALGIPGERASVRGIEFEAPRREPRFHLCHCETGEVYRTYTRRPRHNAVSLRRCYIPGRKVETLGKLVIRPIAS
ncbi:MAG: SprT-like domain-containing protein [Akkermansia sp.]|nr:SprT-like domain-containing protein [Akkermansia sp.]MBR2313474.1 SprT-like domain-containing protein [Akkermansia sp.]